MAVRRKRRRYPDDMDLEAWASELPDSHLLCRDIGHTWRPARAWLYDDGTGYQRVMRCGRCRTEREQSLDMSGHVVGNHYAYADGYLKPKGLGALASMDRDHLRLESVLRLLAKDEQ